MKESQLWKTIVTILATLCVALLAQWMSAGAGTPSRAEMNAAVAAAKTDAEQKFEVLDQKLDNLIDKVQSLEIKTEHVETLVTKK